MSFIFTHSSFFTSYGPAKEIFCSAHWNKNLFGSQYVILKHVELHLTQPNLHIEVVGKNKSCKLGIIV